MLQISNCRITSSYAHRSQTADSKYVYVLRRKPYKCCIVGCLGDAACRTSMRTSALNPWFSIADSGKSAVIPYSSSNHLYHRYNTAHQQSSSWLSSIVEHRPSPFVHQRHHDEHDPCRRQQQDQSATDKQSHCQNSELDGRPFMQLSPRAARQRGDIADLMTAKTQQQTHAKHQADTCCDTRRSASKTSGNTPGIIITIIITIITM